MKRTIMPRSSLFFIRIYFYLFSFSLLFFAFLFLFAYTERYFLKLGLAQSTDRSTVFYSVMPKYSETKAAVSERILRRNLSRAPKAYKYTSRGSEEDRIKNFNKNGENHRFSTLISLYKHKEKVEARISQYLYLKMFFIRLYQNSPDTNYLWIRPVPFPPARALTSSTVTILKSPSMECLRQDAATANSTAS